MKDTTATIAALEVHRDNLSAATTFEEYKSAHVEYVNFLVGYYKAEKAKQDALDHFLARTEIMVKTITEDQVNDKAPA